MAVDGPSELADIFLSSSYVSASLRSENKDVKHVSGPTALSVSRLSRTLFQQRTLEAQKQSKGVHVKREKSGCCEACRYVLSRYLRICVHCTRQVEVDHSSVNYAYFAKSITDSLMDCLKFLFTA